MEGPKQWIQKTSLILLESLQWFVYNGRKWYSIDIGLFIILHALWVILKMWNLLSLFFPPCFPLYNDSKIYFCMQITQIYDHKITFSSFLPVVLPFLSLFIVAKAQIRYSANTPHRLNLMVCLGDKRIWKEKIIRENRKEEWRKGGLRNDFSFYLIWIFKKFSQIKKKKKIFELQEHKNSSVKGC